MTSVNPNGFTTLSDVLIGDDGYMYFRGTDKAVWRVNPYNPTDCTNFGGPNVIATQSNVVATGGYMYLRGTDDKVWRVNIHNPDPNNPVRVNPLQFEGDPTGFTTRGNVNCARGVMYFPGTGDEVWETDGVAYPNPSGFADAFTVPASPRIYIENTDSRQIDNLALVVSYRADFVPQPYELQAQLGTFNLVSAYGLNSMAGNGVGALQEEGRKSPKEIEETFARGPAGLWADIPTINPSITITKEDATEISDLSVTATFTIDGQPYNTTANIGDLDEVYQLELNGGKLAITGQGPQREVNPAFLRFLDILVAILAFAASVGGAAAPGTPQRGWLIQSRM
jgi:hypothetical protein